MLEPPLDTRVSRLLLLETRRTHNMRYNPSRGPVTPSGCQHSVAFSRRCAGITRDFLRWAFFDIASGRPAQSADRGATQHGPSNGTKGARRVTGPKSAHENCLAPMLHATPGRQRNPTMQPLVEGSSCCHGHSRGTLARKIEAPCSAHPVIA
jgi:hypothetical protein